MTNDIKLDPLALADWDPSLSDIIEDMNGRPLNVHSLMAHNPGLLKAWWNFRNYSVNGGSLGRRKGELVILRVAVHMKSWYEWASHVDRSLSCGLSMDEINRVKKETVKDWEPPEAILLSAVDELIEKHALSQETLSTLNKHYSHKQIMDIIAIHGMYIILGCMINSWGLELDPHIKQKLPEKLLMKHFWVDK
ncbi:MAG: carboxymuconolactone decarboxylase family protein [Kordiimonadaceae bacterium]|nr:carboxymuconolactone decarboxylase family protein [Kordiimonadaceae bacterium]